MNSHRLILTMHPKVNGLMERVAGRMAGKSTKRFEAMGGVVQSIGRESTQTERATYIPR